MNFAPTAVDGSWIIQPEFKMDERGFFARVWDAKEFAAHNLSTAFVQFNNSLSRSRGILRGLHWQAEPFGEIKLIRCIRGAIFDVVADVRPQSPTFGKYAGIKLSSKNRHWLYVPSGCAHGYMALDDNSEVLYAATAAYVPSAEHGIRWDDPFFNIKWPPVKKILVSKKDRTWPDFRNEL